MTKSASLILTCLVAVLLSGCTAVRIDYAAKQHRKVANQIKLGDSKSEVLAILEPTQRSVSAIARKSAESFMQDGVVVDVHYMRTGRQPDRLTTDDEFTPYVFHDGVLVGIGWRMLGGPKSQGQVIQPAPRTNINVKQKTVVQ